MNRHGVENIGCGGWSSAFAVGASATRAAVVVAAKVGGSQDLSGPFHASHSGLGGAIATGEARPGWRIQLSTGNRL